MKVPLLDLIAQYQSIQSDIDQAVTEVFRTQQFINGRQVAECEAAIALYCKTSFATGVSSGTDALLITLMAEGIGAGDEVITSDYSFFATAGCVVRSGAKPVLADIDPVTFNLDPNQIESKITPRTKAIIPVHLYGQTADMDPIMEIALKHNLVVIEDAAQAIGAEYKNHRAGSIGHYGCFSFFPSKNLGCAGDGGIVTTNDKSRDDKLKILRNHGAKPKYYHKIIGGNFRLDTIHAAVVLAKLAHLEKWHAGRMRNAALYSNLFTEKGLVANQLISLPQIVQSRHIFNQFVLRVKRRDELINYLKEKNIGCEVYYPVPFHTQECFAFLGHKPGNFPHSYQAAQETIAIPIYPELTEDQIHYVVDTFCEFYS